MMEKPVEDSGCDGGIIVEYARPSFVDGVGGDDDRAAFVSVTDDLGNDRGRS